MIGWYKVNEVRTSLRYHAPEIVAKQEFIPWASIRGRPKLSAEVRLSSCARGPRKQRLTCFGRWTNTNFSMGTGGLHENDRQATNQMAAAMTHASDLTSRSRRLALHRCSFRSTNSTSGIGLESLFLFFTVSLVGPVFFPHTTNLRKKWTPKFADRFGQCGRPMTKSYVMMTYRII